MLNTSEKPFDCERLRVDILQTVEKQTAVCIFDPQGTVIYVNDKFCQLTGYPLEDLLGKSISVLNSATHPDKIAHMWNTISSGKTWVGLKKNSTKEGKPYWSKVTVIPIFNSDGKPIGFIDIKIDLTKQIETASQNSHLNRKLRDEHQKLMRKTHALEELIGHIEEEKRKVLTDLNTNFEFSVFPLLDQLIDKYPNDPTYLSLLKKNLQDIAKPILNHHRDWQAKLTAKEVQICSFIKQGLVVKEIAPIMHLSPRTVEKHRENIRKKLGLRDRKISLSAYLVEHSNLDYNSQTNRSVSYS